MTDPWWASDETVAPPAKSRRERVQARRRDRFWVNDETLGQPTGEAHDGDTFKLSTGQNARVSGYDAFELDQQAQTPLGQLIAIGQHSREALLPQIKPDAQIASRGAPSYGRPVVSIENSGVDPVVGLLRAGNGIATPEYLRDDPVRLSAYMEAERFARQNGQGAFGNTFATPKAARDGKGEPWAAAQPGERGNSDAVFFDDPTPFQGLRPEIALQLETLWSDRSVTPARLNEFAAANGFKLDPKGLEARAKPNARPGGQTQYTAAPKLLTDVGDGRTGATLRGFADPVNMLDEMGAVADSLTGVGGRESVFNSDRRFGDILSNNLDQNRDILANDDAEYPWYRFGGQMASGLIAPGASIEGVGLAAARSAMRGGATRFAAKAAAGRAVTTRLGTVGAVEGGLAGAGQGETLAERGGGALIGGTVGSVLGVGLGTGAPALGRLLGSKLRRGAGELDADPAAHQFVNGATDTLKADVENATVDPRAVGLGGFDANKDELLNVASRRPEVEADVKATLNAVGPDYPFAQALDDIRAKHGPDDGSWHAADEVIEAVPRPADQAMESGIDRPTLIGPAIDAPRVPDRIDLQQPRPLADGPTDWQRFKAAESINPRDVLPVPSNTVSGLNEATQIDTGRVVPVRAPNEMDALASRTIPSPTDGLKTMQKRGPLDLVTWLRTRGGVRAQGGELAHAGIDNRPRAGMDFAGGEGRFGKLVSNEGMTYDEAGEAAWDAGFFAERPTPAEFIDALTQTHNGNQRRFLPDDETEVDDFLRARDERYAVEAAKLDGAPLSVDRGQAVAMADLDANNPPMSAYEEWGENAPNLAGNIRLDKLDSPQAIKRALVRVEQVSGGFDAARRGRIAHAETESLAADLNMTAKQLLSRRKGQAFNAEQALAARQILAKSGNEIVNLAKRIQQGDASEREMVQWRESLVRHAAIQEQVSGITAEAGRALSAMRVVADSRAVNGRVLESLMDAGGGADGLKRAAEMIVEAADDPKRINTITKQLATPGWKDKAVELWYNFLLSGPRTHAVNITSNLLTSMAQIPEHAVAAGVGAARKALRSQAATDRVLFSELGARSFGFLQGAREGLVQAGRTIRTGQTSDLESKVEAQTQAAIGGVTGSILRTPTRLLSAEDELFKAMARRMEIAGLAVRIAKSEGLRGDVAKARIAELTANPTERMLDLSAKYGRYLTFQTPLGPGGQATINWTSRNPWLKLFVPFVRTPINLLKFATERSPAAPILREWRADMAAGGARRDLATARMMVGTGAIMTTLYASQQGMITGNGPADQKARRLLEADGWQPYSFRIGDKYYSYQRLDPFSTTLGLAADYRDLQEYMTEKEREETVNLLLASATQNLANKTWLSGMSNVAEALSDPERYSGSLISGTVGSMTVPAIASQTAQAIDPISRDAQGILAKVRSRIPGASSSLPVRRDVLGRPVEAANGGGLAAFSPMYTRERQNGRIANALLSAGIGITKPNRTVADPEQQGKRITLTPEQYDTYQEMVGDIARPKLEAITQEPVWGRLPHRDREKSVARIMKDAREESRATLMPSFLGRATPALKAPPPGLAGNPDAWWMQDETVK